MICYNCFKQATIHMQGVNEEEKNWKTLRNNALTNLAYNFENKKIMWLQKIAYTLGLFNTDELTTFTLERFHYRLLRLYSYKNRY